MITLRSVVLSFWLVASLVGCKRILSSAGGSSTDARQEIRKVSNVEVSYRTLDEQGQRSQLNDSASKAIGQVSLCSRGSHRQLDLQTIDRHKFNPNHDPSEIVEYHVVMATTLVYGQAVTGRCNDIVRSSPFGFASMGDFSRIWHPDDCMPAQALYGDITIRCDIDGDLEPRLEIVHNGCYEPVPFSTMFEHDPIPWEQDPLQVTGIAREAFASRSASPVYSKELAIYSCEQPPESVVIKTERSVVYENDVHDTPALEECLRMPNCVGVARERGAGKRVQFLSELYCAAGPASVHSRLNKGDTVMWRGPEHDGAGSVYEDWDATSAWDWVKVVFWIEGGEPVRLPAAGLEWMHAPSSWTLTAFVRERTIKCEPLRKFHSCDVYARYDAVVLFDDPSKTDIDCQLACKEKLRDSVGTRSCCVHAGNVCATSEGGDPFALYKDEEAAHSYPQKRFNADPDMPEAASSCYAYPCALDPECAFGAKLEFGAPKDIPLTLGGAAPSDKQGDGSKASASTKDRSQALVDQRQLCQSWVNEDRSRCYSTYYQKNCAMTCSEAVSCKHCFEMDPSGTVSTSKSNCKLNPSNLGQCISSGHQCSTSSTEFSECKPRIEQVVVYMDFAHPLTMPFVQGNPNPHNTYACQLAPESESCKSLNWYPGTFHFTSADVGYMKLRSQTQTRLVRAIGTMPTISSSPTFERLELPDMTKPWSRIQANGGEEKVAAAQAKLDQACSNHGRFINRELHAPRLALALQNNEECIRDHGRIRTVSFEPCLMKLGCRKIGGEFTMVPFHGPWFSQLPYDVLAWQQPAPFCCAVPYNIDKRAEFLLNRFLDNIGLSTNHDEDVSGVDDENVRKTMLLSLKSGSVAIKWLLGKYVTDEETLNWISTFVKKASDGLHAFMTDFEETVESEYEDDQLELSEDASNFLQLHEDGDVVAPSGRKAFVVANWSAERGAFIQVREHLPGLHSLGAAFHWMSNVTRAAGGAVYQYGLKPLWKYVFAPLAGWGISAATWVIDHPKAALFLSKIALGIRDRMCQKTSYLWYGQPGTEAVGLFARVSGKLKEGNDYMRATFSPAVLLNYLQEQLAGGEIFNKFKSLGAAAFGVVLSWAGLATGGAAFAVIGSVVNMIADAAIDASQQALEFLVYQEIAKEVPSNLFDMLTKQCLTPPKAEKRVSFSATVNEVKGAANKSANAVKDAGVHLIETMSQQVETQGAKLTEAMSRFQTLLSSTANFESNPMLHLEA